MIALKAKIFNLKLKIDLGNKLNKLIYTIDDNLIVPFLVSAYSAQKTFGSQVEILIVQPLSRDSKLGLSVNGLKKTLEFLNLLRIPNKVIEVDTSTYPESKLPLFFRFTPTCWLRYYLLFNCTENEIATIYYVEADQIFIPNKDNLFKISPNDSFIVARLTPGHEEFEDKWKSILKVKNWYFNCGVMVIDRVKWQREINQKNFWNVVENYDKFGFKVIEQDALNYTVRGRQENLPIIFNCYPDEFLNLESASILHFAGQIKPWLYSNPILRYKLSKSAKKAVKLWFELKKELINRLARFKETEFPRQKLKLSSRIYIFSPRLLEYLSYWKFLVTKIINGKK